MGVLNARGKWIRYGVTGPQHGDAVPIPQRLIGNDCRGDRDCAIRAASSKRRTRVDEWSVTKQEAGRTGGTPRMLSR